MHVLRIEHPVPEFDAWKEAFDKNPLGRRRSGVRRYRVMRPIGNPSYVMIDLEFDRVEDAEAMLASLRQLWGEVEGTLMTTANSRIVEVVESVELYA